MSEFIARHVWLRVELKRLSELPIETNDPDARALIGFARELAVLASFANSDPWLEPLIPCTREAQLALLEVQRGRHVSWLEPKRKPGWAPRSVEVAQLRGRYAAIMHWLISPGGWTETRAGKLVARHGAIEGLMSEKRSRKARDIEIVRDWRQQAIANSDRELRAGFDHQLSRMGLEGVTVADEAKAWLELLNIIPA